MVKGAGVLVQAPLFLGFGFLVVIPSRVPACSRLQLLSQTYLLTHPPKSIAVSSRASQIHCSLKLQSSSPNSLVDNIFTIIMGVTRLLSQPFSHPPVPTADLTGQTIIVTGANVGLGKEAVKHFVNRGAAQVIATSRSTTKGDAALAEIEGETKRPGVATFWELDYGSYASVKAFCAKVDELDRLDKVILNAGVATSIYEQFEGDESSVTVNAISTTLLALLLLPTLRRSATQYGIVPTLSVTSSEIHTWAKFPERNNSEILRSLSDPKTKTMGERYEVLPCYRCPTNTPQDS